MMVGVSAGAPTRAIWLGRRERERQDAIIDSKTVASATARRSRADIAGGGRLRLGRRRRSVQRPDLVEPAEQSADGGVEVGFVDVAVLHGLHHGRSELTGRARHLEIEPGSE